MKEFHHILITLNMKVVLEYFCGYRRHIEDDKVIPDSATWVWLGLDIVHSGPMVFLLADNLMIKDRLDRSVRFIFQPVGWLLVYFFWNLVDFW